MHSRLKELLEQATTSIKDEYGHWIGSELDEEKFAELIVQECANMFDKDEMELTLTERTIHNMIKEHFGIKE
jgi:hypothetical protein